MTRFYERRAHARAPITERVIVTTQSGDLSGRLVDISRGGIGIEAAAPVPRGEFVRVRFGLPRGEWVTSIDPDAVIVRTESNFGPCVMGLQFLDLYAAWGRVIAGYVSEYHERTAPRPRHHPHARVGSGPVAAGACDTVGERKTIGDEALQALYRAAIQQMDSTKR